MKPSRLGCERRCSCMLDPELRGRGGGRGGGSDQKNKGGHNESEGETGDQNPTTWPNTAATVESSIGKSNININNNNQKIGPGLHTDVGGAACHLVAENHNKSGGDQCVGLQHVAAKDKPRYLFEGQNQVLQDKCNAILRRIWCEQQAHGLTNLCYFISETEKLCFDAVGIPCNQIYGWLDRGPRSFTHAWVKLGEKKQLVDITFYQEKSRSLPGGYWVDLADYREGPGPKSMPDETQFKKKHHWRYVALCTLVENRRGFLRCIFKYMIDQLQVRMPDPFKDSSSSCWNCDTYLGTPGKTIKCPDCSTAVFCSEKCRKEERDSLPSHLEICADYETRRKNSGLLLKKPAVTSLNQLLEGR